MPKNVSVLNMIIHFTRMFDERGEATELMRSGRERNAFPGIYPRGTSMRWALATICVVLKLIVEFMVDFFPGLMDHISPLTESSLPFAIF